MDLIFTGFDLKVANQYNQGSQRTSTFKGQFFILGAVILLSLLLSSTVFFRPIVQTDSVENVINNIAKEHVVALNTIMSNGNNPDNLVQFTNFAKSKVNFTGIWVVSNKDGNLSVAVGNFLGKDSLFNITIGSMKKELNVKNGFSNKTTFLTSDNFKITIEWEGGSRTYEWLEDKVNMFITIQTTNGNNIIKKEIVA